MVAMICKVNFLSIKDGSGGSPNLPQRCQTWDPVSSGSSTEGTIYVDRSVFGTCRVPKCRIIFRKLSVSQLLHIIPKAARIGPYRAILFSCNAYKLVRALNE